MHCTHLFLCCMPVITEEWKVAEIDNEIEILCDSVTGHVNLWSYVVAILQ